MRKTRSLIRDGYYYTALIPGSVNEYGELEITYRPVLPEEVDSVFAKREQDPAAYHAAVRETMAAHIQTWSEWDDAKDQMVPVTVDTVAKLPQGLFWATWNQLFSAVELEADIKN